MSYLLRHCFSFVFLLGLLCSCAPKDLAYYREHPKALQEAIKRCSASTSELALAPNCRELGDLASHLNELALELQANPQLFGQKILKLEEEIAKDTVLLQKEGFNQSLSAALKRKQLNLAYRIAVVKWLTSPEG